MAKEPEENKESKVTLEELASSLDSYSQKIDTTIGDVNTRLDDFQTKFDAFKVPEAPSFTPQTESYVPKGWTPSDAGGWNDVFDQSSKIAKESAATAAATAVNAYKDEVAQEQKDRQSEEAKINKGFDDQIDSLEKDGRLPKVEDENSDTDPGIVARKELYQLGVDYSSSDLIAMAKLRDKVKSIPPQGIDAPVGSSTRTTDVPSSVDYNKDIRGKSMDEMVQEEFPR